MPSKRGSMRRGVIKQTQTIKTRLIEISLKVEDLVYNKKPITEKEAENYMREVNSYRNICYKDDRALQVIEKLIRCMKAIIAEHEELKLNQNITDDDSSVEFDYRSSVSPVYSLPDEDRIQLTQTLVDVNDFHDNISNTIATDKANYYDESTLTQNIRELEITENDKNNETMQLFIKVKENEIVVDKINALSSMPELHKALSNLSITDTNLDEELMSIDIESSQSILNNIDPLEYISSPPAKNIHLKHSGVIEVTKTATKDCVKSKQLTNYFHVNETSIVAKTNMQDFEHTRINDCENGNKIQQTEIIHLNFLSNMNNNKIIKKPNTNKADTSTFCSNKTDFEKQIPVTINNANTMVLFKNKTESNVNSEALDKKHKMRNQIAENILKYTSKSKQPKSLTKSLNPVHKQANYNQANYKEEKYDSIKQTTKICSDNNVTCNNILNLRDKSTNMNTMQKLSTKGTIQKNIAESKSTYCIKKKRCPRKTKEGINNTIKKDSNVKKVTLAQKRKIYDLNNKTKEYQHKRKYKKQSITHNNNEDVISIYNKNVINDLSWLENIRFVREIGDDEYDHSNLNESFWDNYELPPHFDHNDFL